MKLQEVKVKKRFKFENLGFILLIISVIFAFISMIYFMNGAQKRMVKYSGKNFPLLFHKCLVHD